MLACIIFSLFATSPPAVDPNAAAVSMVWNYIGELVFNMLVLVGAVKMSDRVVREMMGFVKYNGMNAEQFVWAWIKSEFLMPKKLMFHPNNLYYEALKATIQNHEKEALKNNA